MINDLPKSPRRKKENETHLIRKKPNKQKSNKNNSIRTIPTIKNLIRKNLKSIGNIS